MGEGCASEDSINLNVAGGIAACQELFERQIYIPNALLQMTMV